MVQKNATSFETLESRTLMSASPFDTAVKADRVQIRADLLKLDADFFADAGTLLTDNRALKADHLSSNTVLHPLVATLRSDVYSFDLALRADRLTEAANVITDEQVVVTELQKMFTDRKNPTALAADKSQLITDRANLQSAMVAGLTQRITDRESEISQITTDTQAILTALPNSGANAKLTSDLTQFLTDKSAALTKITADLTKLSGDRTQLITDLNAENA
jgi:hypothetical protein